MKYRAIIADDEPKLIQLIKQLGKFEEIQIEIIDECHNGDETYVIWENLIRRNFWKK